MLADLVRFEWRYHTRQATFYAASLLSLVFGFVLPATGFGPENVAINAPFLVMESQGLLSLMVVFVAAAFAASAVLRDSEHGMQEIVHSTPIPRVQFLAVRFTGVFLAASTAAACSLVGMIAGTLMPWLDPQRVAPFEPLRYLWAFAVLMLPNVLFATAILLGIAALTRNAMVTYAGSVLIYVLYFVVAAMTNSPMMAGSRPGMVPGPLVAALDPFGLTAFFDLTRYWTGAVKNSRFVPLAGALLYNRMIALGITIAIATFVCRSFSFRLSRRKKRAAIERPETESQPIITRTSRDVRVTPSWLASYRSAARVELRVLRSVPVLLLLLLWIGFAASEVDSRFRSSEYGAPMIPASSLAFSGLLQPIAIMGTILLMYFGAEMFWRERRYKMASILDATPVSGATMIAAKWTGMAALVVAVITSGIVTTIALQLARGYTHLEPLVELSLFYVAGVPLLLFAAAVVLVNALSPNKYAAMMFTLLAALFTRVAPRIGLNHPLWRFAEAPPVRYSDMNGFGHDLIAFSWFMLHWTAIAVVMLLIAAALWRAATRANWRAIAIAASLAIATGSWIFYNTDVLNTRVDAASLDDWKAGYEKTWKPLATLPQPHIEAIAGDVDLDPDGGRYRVAGHYDLINDSGAPIRTVLVSARREADGAQFSMSGAREIRDAHYGMSRFELAQPLAPGARTVLNFDIRFALHGFTGSAPDDVLAANGSFLFSTRAFPGIGYRRSYELQDARERKRRGLSPLAASLSAQEGPDEGETKQRIALHLTIATPADQTAIAPGHLERTWIENGHRFFEYRSDTPIFNQFAIASARYDVARAMHDGVEVEVFYDPAHRANAQRVLDIAATTLDYCQTQFGPYPGRQLRLAEVPSYWPFGAFAMPETVFMVENRTMLLDASAPARVDLLARRIAHEVAHQWWGNTLVPAEQPGSTLLVESLAKYTELKVLEHLHGPEQVSNLLEIELDRYLSGRAQDPEPERPLYLAGSEDYLYYGKGALAMHALGERMGEERVNLALHNLLAAFRDRGGRATSLDLLAELHRADNDNEHAALIDEWMKEIAIYDIRLESAHAQKRTDGRYDVRLEIDASKRMSDRDVPFRTIVNIDSLGAYELHEGHNTLTVVADKVPDPIVIDPDFEVIDANRADNAKSPF